eukprot:m51a1_g12322 hypothetical protein (1068) ;mRNA; f:424694-430925
MSGREKRDEAWCVYKEHLLAHGLRQHDILTEDDLRSVLSETSLSKSDQLAVVARWRKRARAAASPLSPRAGGRDASEGGASVLTDAGSPAPSSRRRYYLLDSNVEVGTGIHPPSLWPPDFKPEPAASCLSGVGLRNRSVEELLEAARREVRLVVGVQPDQALALALWTQQADDAGSEDGSVRAALNNALQRGGLGELSKWRSFLWHLLSALRALPAFHGTAFCATATPSRLFVGQIVTRNQFTSCKTAPLLAREVPTGTLFQVEVQCGVSLSGMSPFTENEVVLEPNTELIVTSRQTQGDLVVVTLSQLPLRFQLELVPGERAPATGNERQEPQRRFSLIDTLGGMFQAKSPRDRHQSTIESFFKEFTTQNGVTLLLRALARHRKSPSIVQLACTVLTTTAKKNDGVKVVLSTESNVELALSMIQRHSSSLETTDALCHFMVVVLSSRRLTLMQSQTAVVHPVCKILFNLSADAAALKAISKEDVVPLVIGVLRSFFTSMPIVEKACGLLGNLCYLFELALSKEALPLVFSILRNYSSTSPRIVQVSCGTLANLARKDEIKMVVGKQGGIGMIVQALGYHARVPFVVEDACRALKSLAANKANRSIIVCGMPPDLAEFLKKSYPISSSVKSFACVDVVSPADLTAHTTHIIATTTDSEKYRAAARSGIHIVLPSWLDACLARSLRVDERKFCVPPLLGCIVCPTGLEVSERDALQDAVAALGGEYSADLTRTVTHLVALEPSGNKYDAAVLWEGVHIVSPQWVPHCAAAKVRVDEALYPVAPLRPGHETADRAGAPSDDAPGAAKPSREPVEPAILRCPQQKCVVEQDEGRLRVKRAVYSNVFEGVKFLVAGCEPRQEERIALFIAANSGSVVEPGNVRQGTVDYWLEQSLERKRLLDVSLTPLLTPLPRRLPYTFMKKFRITITGFGEDSRSLKFLIFDLGAQFTESLSRKNTHLVCNHAEGAKYRKAQEWNVPAVSKQWLFDCVVIFVSKRIEADKAQHIIDVVTSMGGSGVWDYSAMVTHYIYEGTGERTKEFKMAVANKVLRTMTTKPSPAPSSMPTAMIPTS